MLRLIKGSLGTEDAISTVGFQEGLPTTAVAVLHGLAVYRAKVRPQGREALRLMQ